MNGHLLEVQGLVKHFHVGGWPKPRVVHAVDGVSFEIDHGETLGLVGESGSGKSTVGRSILQLIEATGGEVIFKGMNLTRLRGKERDRYRRQMQIVFQDPAGSLNPRFTIKRILSEPYKRFGLLSKDQIRSAIIQLLEDTGLQEADLEKFPHNFSGGQQQRIAVARALAPKPALIVLDEPTSSLDVSVRMQIIDLLQKLQKEYDLAYLFISHDLSVIRHVCDRTAVMYLGQFVEVGPTAEMFASPKHPYTKALIDAVPIPDPEARYERLKLEGEVPSVIEPPPGCRFHPRCPQARPICGVETCGELYPVAHNWKVACHRVIEDNQAKAAMDSKVG